MMMKLAYVIEWNCILKDGVLTKIENLMLEWQKNHITTKLFIIPLSEENSVRLEVNNKIYRTPKKLGNYKALNRLIVYLNKSVCSFDLKNDLKKYNPDIIYCRQSTWYPWKISNIYKVSSTIVELNTLRKNELNVGNLSRLLLNKLTDHFHENSIDGYIAVTEEIARSLEGINTNVTTIANGYKLDGLNIMRPTINERASLIFVGTPDQIWHGVDKFANLAEELPEYDFHLVGPSWNGRKIYNLYSYGYLNQTELQDLYSRVDIGVGTLALHRKNMNEACPLKVREYIAYGLPVIIGYKDTDVSNKPFSLEIPNIDGSEIQSLSEIRSFVKTWKGRRLSPIDREVISLEKKEKKRVEYFIKIINKRGNRCDLTPEI